MSVKSALQLVRNAGSDRNATHASVTNTKSVYETLCDKGIPRGNAVVNDGRWLDCVECRAAVREAGPSK